jgi:hypothetical protein
MTTPLKPWPAGDESVSGSPSDQCARPEAGAELSLAHRAPCPSLPTRRGRRENASRPASIVCCRIAVACEEIPETRGFGPRRDPLLAQRQASERALDLIQKARCLVGRSDRALAGLDPVFRFPLHHARSWLGPPWRKPMRACFPMWGNCFLTTQQASALPASQAVDINRTYRDGPAELLAERLDLWRVRQYIPANLQPARLRRISGAAVKNPRTFEPACRLILQNEGWAAKGCSVP